ncbi:hypothetical protein [Streptomyces sp. NPDC051014]|uniref:hypothetical protein n=1 Tax=Streptomyces sp. NPDC051014 TaxID=3155751 RepID=UPI0033F33FDD
MDDRDASVHTVGRDVNEHEAELTVAVLVDLSNSSASWKLIRRTAVGSQKPRFRMKKTCRSDKPSVVIRSSSADRTGGTGRPKQLARAWVHPGDRS